MLRSEGTYWTCNECTLTNSKDAKICIVCGASSVLFHASEMRDLKVKGVRRHSYEMKCEVCTFLNSGNVSSCQMCDSVLDTVELRKQAFFTATILIQIPWDQTYHLPTTMMQQRIFSLSLLQLNLAVRIRHLFLSVEMIRKLAARNP